MANSWFRSRSYFTYEALSCDQIRLVTINPGSISQSITCSIQNVPLCERMPVYSAISYTWGSSIKSKTIFCDNPGSDGPRRLMVTANLEIAMRYIRQAAKPITVWIDQLCINQDNAEERESQVKMMGLIYRYAEDVLIWLGVEADNSSSA
ncbi:HET-domain-containing protein, partial [Cadophora sp. DSE1049]